MEDYKNPEFVVYCIETYKNVKGLAGQKAYELLKQKKALDFIDECYDTLHATGDLDIVGQIDEFIENGE